MKRCYSQRVAVNFDQADLIFKSLLSDESQIDERLCDNFAELLIDLLDELFIDLNKNSLVVVVLRILVVVLVSSFE